MYRTRIFRASWLVAAALLVATPQQAETGEPNPTVEILDAYATPTARGVDIRVKPSGPINTTTVVRLTTRNGVGTNSGTHYTLLHKAPVVFYPGDEGEKTLRLPLTGRAKPGDTIEIVPEFPHYGHTLIKRISKVVFQTSDKPAWLSPDYDTTFSPDLSAAAFRATDSGYDEAGNPVWRTRLSHGRTQPGNKELGYYADAVLHPGTQPIQRTAEGKLKLVSEKIDIRDPINDKRLYHYTASVITTQMLFSQQYGAFEAVLSFDKAAGFWPAFWLLPTDGSWPPEIDILELPMFAGAELSDNIWVTQHWVEAGVRRKMGSNVFLPVFLKHRADIFDGPHAYGVEWTPDWIRWMFDGVEVFKTPNRVHTPMYLLINTAVGGWAGNPNPANYPAGFTIHNVWAGQKR